MRSGVIYVWKSPHDTHILYYKKSISSHLLFTRGLNEEWKQSYYTEKDIDYLIKKGQVKIFKTLTSELVREKFK